MAEIASVPSSKGNRNYPSKTYQPPNMANAKKSMNKKQKVQSDEIDCTEVWAVDNEYTNDYTSIESE